VNPRLSSRHAARGLRSQAESQQYTTTGRLGSSVLLASVSILRRGRLIAPGRWSSWNSSVGSTSTTWTPCFIRPWTSWRLTSRTLTTSVRLDLGSTVEWRSPNHEVPLQEYRITEGFPAEQ